MRTSGPEMRERVLNISDLKLSPVTRINCLHGCAHYRKGPFCPPNCPDIEHMQSLIGHYEKVCVLHATIEYESNDDLVKIRNVCHEELLKREQQMKRSGHYYALAMISGPCSLCEGEICHSDECRRGNVGRIPVCASGIDLKHLCKELLDVSQEEMLSYWMPNMAKMFEGTSPGRYLYVGMVLF